MEILDMFWFLIVALSAFLVLVLVTILSKQRQAMSKLNQSLKHQETVLKRFDSVLRELRQSNRFLAELAAMEWSEEPAEKEHGAHHAHTHDHTPPRPAHNAQDTAEQASTHHHDHAHGHHSHGAESSENASENNEHKLYVGNIDYAATEAELAAYFSEYGMIEATNIPVNRYTGRARGFGFVTFGSRVDAEAAMALNGSTFKGRQIQVNFAKERESHS